MALATAGVLGLPVTGLAGTAQDPAPQQQPQPQPQPTPQPEQQQPTPQPAQPQPQPTPQPAQPQPQPTPQPQPNPPQPTASPAPQSKPEQAVSPQEHLRQAQAAVNSIEATAVPAKDRASLAQLKRHFTALERAGTSTATETPKAPGAAASKQVNWGTEVAAIDKIITELLGNDTAKSPGATPTPTGTAGTKAAGTMIDDATRAKLLDVRTHITAYAAGMAGGTSTPKTEAAMSADQPSPAANAPSAAAAAPAATSNASSPASSTPASSTAQAAPAQSPNAAAQPPAESAQSAAAAPAGQSQADTEAAHRHLIAARDSLSQLTALPAAAQLSGEARTQVSQLITNFNELITTKADWRASYQKVAANLNSLIGPDNSDAEAAGGAPTATTGATAAPGAVGTAGTATVELDPTVRAKLVELRKNLAQFEKASGGVNPK